jgi:L-ascorbate metabolism protein UlaG (beta-lactamase superfamily)
MRVRWYGQSAFLLSGEQQRVFIDPFGDMSFLAERGLAWHYPPIEGVDADLVLVTHEHSDHNAAEVIGGRPTVIRSAGTHGTPLGEVVGIVAEHDQVAGTQRGAITIFRFVLDGVRIAHLGDLGQAGLRPEQRAALGEVDVLLLPVGGGPTIPVADAVRLVRELAPRLVVPMHYRNELIGFLDPPEPFLAELGAEVRRLPSVEFDVVEQLQSDLAVLLPALPTRTS